MADEKKRATTERRRTEGWIAFRLARAFPALLLVCSDPQCAASAQPDTLTLTNASLAAPAGKSPSKEPIAIWVPEVRVSLDGGYRQNVLRSSVAPEETAFVHSTAEFSFLRLSESGSEFNLFTLVEDWRYPDCASVGYEQLASATAQGLWPVGEKQTLSAEVQYFYQHQVLDLSETDTDLRRLLVKGHSLYARPKWRFSFDPQWAIQVEATAMRQIYAGNEVDDYWEPAGRVSLMHNYGNRSEASGYLQIGNRIFDTWEKYQLSGNAITNSHLQYWRPEFGGQIRHFWDKDRHWRTLTRVSYMWNRDNGTGYFDFGRLLVSQQVRWRTARWEIRGGARIGWYLYDTQFVAGEKRSRSYVIADLRIERRLGKHFFGFLAGEVEWDFSNDPIDEYEDSWMGVGLGLDF